MPPITEAVLRRPKSEEKAKEPKKTPNKDVNEAKRNKFAAAHSELQAATSLPTHRMWTRTVIILSVMTLVYFYTNVQNRDMKFATVNENLTLRTQKYACDEATFTPDELLNYPACVPKKCGRFVKDQGVVEQKQIKNLLDLATQIFDRTPASGGVHVFDMQSGAVTVGSEFKNAFLIPELKAVLTAEHKNSYTATIEQAKRAIAEQFDVNPDHLYITLPSFFTRMSNVTAKTMHDEYWHEHVDRETYPYFQYTSLMYLNTYGKDFQGGRFMFVHGSGDNRTTASVEPKAGRFSAFTSGAENRHFVEPVTSGQRYALTIAFSCTKKQTIPPETRTQTNSD